MISSSLSSVFGVLGSGRVPLTAEPCCTSGEYSESLSTLGAADESSEAKEETDERESDWQLLELPSAKLSGS